MVAISCIISNVLPQILNQSLDTLPTESLGERKKRGTHALFAIIKAVSEAEQIKIPLFAHLQKTIFL
jgi:hypothetical protein